MSHYQINHKNNEKRLWIALALTLLFIVVEVIGSVISHSLALLSDAAHLFTDAAALIISITAMRMSRKEADLKRTFGYYRFEILAATFNATLLFLVAFYIFYQVYDRIFTPHTLHSTSMLIVAIFGLAMNLINLSLLQPGSRESLNIKSAYLDAKADMLSSLGVIVTAVFLKITEWQYIDSVMAIAIALWILPRSWLLLKESVNILLEGVPEGIDLSEINQAFMALPGVLEVHDLHVWALTNGKISLTAHFVVDKAIQNEQPLLQMTSQALENQFGITHSTIQIETTKCDHSNHSH